MEKNILRYNKPRFATYNCSAAIGMVLQNHPDADNWYYNNAILVRCKEPNNRDKHFDIDFSLATSHPHMIEHLITKHVELFYIKDIVNDIIVNLIDCDYYIHFHGVDDYFLKGKSNYLKRHFCHDGVIYGYNNVTEVYNVAAYNDSWNFDCFELSKDDFLAGLNSLLYSNSFFYAIKIIKPIRRIGIDLKKIKQTIQNYLSPIDFEAANSGYSYGINTYDTIIQYISDLIDNDRTDLDQRVFSLMLEHKTCIYEMINSTVNKSKDSEYCIEKYYKVLKNARVLNVLAMRYNLKLDKRLLLEISNVVERMKSDEKEAFECYLEVVEVL